MQKPRQSGDFFCVDAKALHAFKSRGFGGEAGIDVFKAAIIKSTMSAQRYHRILVAIHWILALLLIFLLLTGALVLTGLEVEAARLNGLRVHMTIGIIILVLMFIRIFIRRWTQKPEPATTGNSYLDKLSRIVHILLYVCVIAMAASGIVTAGQAGLFEIIFAGSGAPIPDDLTVYRPRQAHGFLAKALMVLFTLHIGGALYHQFIRQDGLLRRMWFSRQK